MTVPPSSPAELDGRSTGADHFFPPPTTRIGESTMNTKPILVTGATGKTGRRVARLLREGGHTVREGSRSTEPPFDWEDPSTWTAALENVEKIYVVLPDLGSLSAIEQSSAFARAAVAAGTRRAVLVSVPLVGGMDPDVVCATEEQFSAAGLELTTLRLRWFFQNFTEDFLRDDVMSRALRLPAGQGREAFVDADDIAEVAVTALTDDQHSGHAYEITGPETITFADVAATITEATGQVVSYEALTLEQYVDEQKTHGVPEEFAQMLGEIYQTIASGALAKPHDDVERILGKPARSFRQFAFDAADSWTV